MMPAKPAAHCAESNDAGEAGGALRRIE